MTKSTRSKSKKAHIELPAVSKVLPEIRGIGMIEVAFGSNTFNLGTQRKCSSRVTVVLMITYVTILIKYFVVISTTSSGKWWHRKNIRVLISDLF